VLSDYLKGGFRLIIPKDRAKALLRIIEEIRVDLETNVEVNVDTGEVVIRPTERASVDSLMKARSIVEAVGYGFEPEEALNLRNSDYVIHTIDLRNYVDKDKQNHMRRIRARLIGEEGRTRRILEELTGASIVVGERYVSIMGTYEEVEGARNAVEMIINGKQHSTVYRWLQRWRRELRYRQISDIMERSYSGDSG
jgi:ribosomal RNA assembly protein